LLLTVIFISVARCKIRICG